MKIIAIIFSLYCCAIIEMAYGQSEKIHKGKVRFRSSFYSGVSEGEKGGFFQLQTLNGISYKTLFAGIGIGLDHYSIRSIPIVLQLEKNFTVNPSGAFAYVNGGLNFPWSTNNPEQSNMKYGWIYEFGLGYRAQAFKKNALLFCAGYSVKQLKQIVPGWPINIDPQFNWLNYDQHYFYSFKTLSLKVGFIF